MPTSHSFRNLCARLLAGLGMVALIVQLTAPAMANTAGGEWMVICSGQGPVLIHVDFEDDDSAPTPINGSCGNCIFCASYGAALPEMAKSLIADRQLIGLATLPVFAQSVPAIAHLRPQTRGPPHGEENKTALMPGAFAEKSEGAFPWS